MPNSDQSLVSWLRAAVTSPGVGGVLARGSASGFVVKAFGMGIVFVMHILLARALGAVSYGHYVYAISWIQILAIFAAAGMNPAGARFVAEYRARDEPGLLLGFLRFSLTLALVAAIIASLATAGAVLLLRNHASRELVITFWIGCFLLPLLTILEVRSGALRGLKRILLARFPFEVLRPTVVSLGLLGIYFILRSPLDATAVMLLNLVATALAYLIIETGLRRSLGKDHGTEVILEYRQRKWLAVGFQLLLIASATLVLGHTDTLMLGALRNTTEAGIFAVSSRLASLVSFMLLSANLIVAPQIAELYSSGRMRELQRVLTLAARLILGFSLPAGLVLLFGGRWILELFGPDFRQGYPALLFLLIGQIVFSLTGPVGSVLTMTGRQRRAAWILGSAALINIILNATLIPRFGMLGAAAATSITMMGWNIALLAFVVRDLRLNPTVLPVKFDR